MPLINGDEIHLLKQTEHNGVLLSEEIGLIFVALCPMELHNEFLEAEVD